MRVEYAISASDEFEKEIAAKCDVARTLKLGIVGRVKAGKSSLLNALLFDGVTVLPKAATPMTAALPVLEHGELLQATVDFFTQNDVKTIEAKHGEYGEKLHEMKEAIFAEQDAKKKKKPPKTANPKKVESPEKVERKAKQKMK